MRIVRIVLLLQFLIPGFIAYTQEYDAVIKTNTSRWLFAHKQLAGSFIDTLFAGSDTDRGIEVWYRGIYYNGDRVKVGVFRVSENQEQIWYSPSDDTTKEYLVYDISLSEDDEFQFNWSPDPVLVDTVYYTNEQKIIEFEDYSDWDEPIKFIEGIGPNITLAWQWKDPGILSPILVCVFENSLKVYQTLNNHFIECSLNTSLITPDLIPSFEIYPNPFDDIIYIKFSDLIIWMDFEVSIFSHTGKLVYQNRFSGTRDFCIREKDLRPGLYIIKLAYSNQILFEKLIKL